MSPSVGKNGVPSNIAISKATLNSNNVVTLNVGGQIFQTTAQTLFLAGPDSLLSALASGSDASPVPFVDRDPELFAALLSLLRSGRLSSAAPPGASFDLDDLVAEARFYSLDPQVLLPDAALFDPFSLRCSLLLPLPGRDAPSALSVAGSGGALVVAHGGNVSSFDPVSLRRRATSLTPLPVVDSLLALPGSGLNCPLLAAAGAADFPGLHVLDLRPRGGSLRHVLHWSPQNSAPGAAAVQAVGSSFGLLFGSFESCRRNASAIVVFDLATLQPVAEIGRQEIYGAELDSAIPATKLQWLGGFNLLMAAGSHASPSGVLRNIRLWDVRSGEAVVDLKEKDDYFADVTVSDGLSQMFKVGLNSGEVFMSDIRKLSGNEGVWACAGDGRRTSTGTKEGSGCRMESHGRQVFCTRGGDVEMWSEVLMRRPRRRKEEEELVDGQRVMRKNVMGGMKDAGGKRISLLGFGGNRMVVARKDEQWVEVWDSAAAAAAADGLPLVHRGSAAISS